MQNHKHPNPKNEYPYILCLFFIGLKTAALISIEPAVTNII